MAGGVEEGSLVEVEYLDQRMPAGIAIEPVDDAEKERAFRPNALYGAGDHPVLGTMHHAFITRS